MVLKKIMVLCAGELCGRSFLICFFLGLCSRFYFLLEHASRHGFLSYVERREGDFTTNNSGLGVRFLGDRNGSVYSYMASETGGHEHLLLSAKYSVCFLLVKYGHWIPRYWSTDDV